jgi:hypothetical protein
MPPRKVLTPEEAKQASAENYKKFIQELNKNIQVTESFRNLNTRVKELERSWGERFGEFAVNKVSKGYKKTVDQFQVGLSAKEFNEMYPQLAELNLSDSQTDRLTRRGTKVLVDKLVKSNTHDDDLRKINSSDSNDMPENLSRNIYNGAILIKGRNDKTLILTSKGDGYDMQTGLYAEFDSKKDDYEVWGSALNIMGVGGKSRARKQNRRNRTHRRR